MFEVVLTGAVAGLVSAPHCAVMCGPIGLHATQCSPRGFSRYQAGRSLGYVALGMGAGAIGKPLVATLWSSAASAALSIGLALVLVLAAVRIWPRSTRKNSNASREMPLVPLRPRKSMFARILARLPKSPELLGACTGLLPCGALWSGLALAITSGSPISGGILMLSFASTSSLGVWFSSHILPRAVGATSLATAPRRARALAVVLAVGATILIWRPIAMSGAFRSMRANPSASAPAEICPLHQGPQP